MIHKIETYSGNIYVELPNVSICLDSIKRIVPVVSANGKYVELFSDDKTFDHE